MAEAVAQRMERGRVKQDDLHPGELEPAISIPITCHPQLAFGTQIGDEAPDHDAAWLWECRCGLATFAHTWKEGQAKMLAKHKAATS